MTNFKIKKINSQDLGEYLTRIRKQRNLSREEIFSFTKIHPRHLEALETGRFADLPAAVYVKGFLRSLAKIYHVDEAALVSRYEAESGIEKNLAALTSVKQKLVLPRFVLSQKTLAVLFISVLAVTGFGYLYFQVSSLAREPFLEIIQPMSDTLDSSLVFVEGTAEAGSQVFLNNQPILVDADGYFKESLSLSRGANRLEIRAVNKFGKEKKITRQIIYLEKEISGVSSAQGSVLQLATGSSPSWIKLEVDGRIEYQGIMDPEQNKKFTFFEKAILSTGNAGSTKVIFNGKDLGILGKDGEALENIEFTPAP